MKTENYFLGKLGTCKSPLTPKTLKLNYTYTAIYFSFVTPFYENYIITKLYSYKYNVSLFILNFLVVFRSKLSHGYLLFLVEKFSISLIVNLR